MDSEHKIAEQNLSVVHTDSTYPSSNGEHDVYASMWACPAFLERYGSYVGIVQIAHGMTEYVGRYDEFASILARAGYIVVGNDHLAHGHTARDASELGVISGEKGADWWVEDVHRLRQVVLGKAEGNLPYFLLGHSMGSFIVRAFLAREGYADGLTGAIIEGTGNPAPIASSFGSTLASLSNKFKGEAYSPNIVTYIAFGPYAKSIENARTPNDWLSRNDSVIDAYRADPFCSFRFSAGAYKSLFKLTGFVAKQEAVDAIPKELPLFIVSGDADPVGDMGKAPRKLQEMCQRAGMQDVELKLYPCARHELHNELCREEFYADILDWLARHNPRV